ncbi:MAG: plasmid pRiA4b ORF-3 family protein [Chlamydiae bacterium]|nr:plasmid pRiA4b ORF-3 family protein [Chlamydiota bacterium]MBI5465143.1 plasmid pRiA4b ORF-3 family protein [Candidatus Gottesmanbacteria bacterium]
MKKSLYLQNLNKPLAEFKHVYQFKISLQEIQPLIWRRIQVPENYTFWDFHVAIQDVMGWLDYHLHSFVTENLVTGKKEHIGIPEEIYDECFDDYETLPGWDLQIGDYFSEERRFMQYLYDYGDGWDHLIEYEAIFFKKPFQKYPVCLDGARSGPPEDCGGVPGYENFIKIIKDPLNKESQSMRKWAGKDKCNTEVFDKKNVHFDNPKTRFKKAFLKK